MAQYFTTRKIFITLTTHTNHLSICFSMLIKFASVKFVAFDVCGLCKMQKCIKNISPLGIIDQEEEETSMTTNHTWK